MINLIPVRTRPPSAPYLGRVLGVLEELWSFMRATELTVRPAAGQAGTSGVADALATLNTCHVHSTVGGHATGDPDYEQQQQQSDLQQRS